MPFTGPAASSFVRHFLAARTGGCKSCRFLEKGCPVFQPVRAAATVWKRGRRFQQTATFREPNNGQDRSHGGDDIRQSKTTRRKPAVDDPARSAETRKHAKKEAVIEAALRVEDAFYNLRWAHRAYDCVQNFLASLNTRNAEGFLVEPRGLTALMELVNAEMGRRIQTVEKAIHAARKVMH